MCVITAFLKNNFSLSQRDNQTRQLFEGRPPAGFIFIFTSSYT